MSAGSSSSASSCCHRFSLDEIKDARNHFGKSKLLGRGGEAKVYLTKVYIQGEDTRVAVKHLLPGSNGLEKELETVSKIQHPHIISLLGYCEESGQKILVYELMKNGTLHDYVKKGGSRVCLSWQQRLNICLGAARGLQHLHTPTEEFPFGIIHRDVKPGNILVDANLVGKVSDFGMFKLSCVGQPKSSMTTDLKGTRGYYAPEYVGSSRVTRKIDVYAFGVVLFEVLCCKMPWDRGGESYYRREDEDLGLWAQENVDAEIKREISERSLKAFTDIISNSLRKNPDERPTMDDVVLDLEKVLKYQRDHQEAMGLVPMGSRQLIRRRDPEVRTTHAHTMVQFESDRRFRCGGCNILGRGKRCRCQRQECDFDLHQYCYMCPSIQFCFMHPHRLNLVVSKGESMLLICNVCDKPIEGRFYKCNDNCDFDVHPLCTQLPQNLSHVLHLKHLLNLQTSTPSLCNVCGEECASWRYGCEVCSFNIHLECVSKGPTTMPNFMSPDMKIDFLMALIRVSESSVVLVYLVFCYVMTCWALSSGIIGVDSAGLVYLLCYYVLGMPQLVNLAAI